MRHGVVGGTWGREARREGRVRRRRLRVMMWWCGSLRAWGEKGKGQLGVAMGLMKRLGELVPMLSGRGRARALSKFGRLSQCFRPPSVFKMQDFPSEV